MRRLFTIALAILRKDLLVELRTRESFTAMLVFAVMSVVMFNFALRLRVDTLKPLVPGILWVTLVFAGTLGLSRSMLSEQLNAGFDALMLAPGDRMAVFIGKALANLVFTLAVGLFVLPVMAILFDEGLIQPGVLLTVALGCVAYSGAGTLIVVMAASTRAREVFLPILLFPLVLPLVVAAVIVTAGFADRAPFEEFGAWMGVIVAFILIFWTAGTLLFEPLVEG